jgi:hypothetical protein
VTIAFHARLTVNAISNLVGFEEIIETTFPLRPFDNALRTEARFAILALVRASA